MDFKLFPGGKPPQDVKPPAADQPPPEAKPPEGPAGGGGKPPVYRYRCVQACTFQKRYRKEGDIIELPEKRDIPRFELI
jgi:hypothetical protein